MLEIIVVDRGSLDGTLIVAESVGEPVRVITRPGSTTEDAIRAGTEEAKGGTVVVAPVRARYAPNALRQCLDGRSPSLVPVGTTAFGRAAAAVAPGQEIPALRLVETEGRVSTTAAPSRSWYFMPDTRSALARHAFRAARARRLTSRDLARAGLVVSAAALACNRRPWARVALPLAHTVSLATVAWRAGRDPGVAPHRAFMAGLVTTWCGGVGTLSRVLGLSR